MIHVFYARGEGISEAKTTAKGLAGSFSRSWIAGVVSHWQGLVPKSSRRDQKTMLNIIGRNIVCYGNSRQITSLTWNPTSSCVNILSPNPSLASLRGGGCCRLMQVTWRSRIGSYGGMVLNPALCVIESRITIRDFWGLCLIVMAELLCTETQ